MTPAPLSEIVRGFSVPAKTSVPFTYCIWYRPDPDDESFIAELKDSPPDLYHLGYQLPFKGGYGPAYGGELYSDDMLPPGEVHREIGRIKHVIEKMRGAGVARLMPYVFTMAFFGRPKERKGFFNFYDHWDEYRDFGLGPKPDADPSLWSQVRGPHQLGGGPPGVLHYDPCVNHPGWLDYLDLVVRQVAAIGYDGIFFDVNSLYCFCPYCQAKFDVYLFNKYGPEGLRDAFGTDDHRRLHLSTIYPDFQDTVLHAFKAHLGRVWDSENLSALLGSSGPHNISLERDAALLRCHMQGSLAEFPPAEDFGSHLLERFGGNRANDVPSDQRPEFVQTVLRHFFVRFLESGELAGILEKRFGSSDVRRRCCGTPQALLLWVETQRFWCDSLAALFTRLKKVARGVFAELGRNDDFYTINNLGPVATLDGVNNRRIDGTDLPRRARVTDMSMCEEMLQPGSLESGVIISNVFAFRWAMAAGTRAGTLLYQACDDIAADLAEAEAAAGGGGAFIECALFAPESRKRWRRFFAQHADLWDQGSSWARVAVLFWSDQMFYEYPEHYAVVRALVHILSETQVPFDIVTEEHAQSLTQYELVIAPRLRYLDSAKAGLLLDYARQGGNLVVIDPFGTEDLLARPRPSDLLADCRPAATDFHCSPCGMGRVLRLDAESVPQRRSDLWCLMEDRANNFALAWKFLNEARRRDLDNGVDLGPAFVAKLEAALGFPLRCCGSDTDPGVYIHAYRMPPLRFRPERLIVHAVNYRIPICPAQREAAKDPADWLPVSEAGPPDVIAPLHVSVPVPTGKTVHAVRTLSPTDPSCPVTWCVEEDRVVSTVEQLHIYQAIVIEL